MLDVTGQQKKNLENESHACFSVIPLPYNVCMSTGRSENSVSDSRPDPRPGSRSDLLFGLNAAQREAVVSTQSPLCILAGAGSGKTRVLTRRIAWRIAEETADPARIMAITFTRKAAGELSKRLTQLGVRERIATGTFHSIAFAQLRQFWADQNRSVPTLTQSKIRLIMPLLASRPPANTHNVQGVDLAAEIEWAKARLITPDRYAEEVQRAGRVPPLGAEAMADLYRRYEADKRRRGIIDFDDLLVMTVEAMASDKEFAARQRWRFRHLFVDEFQDVNPAQARLLDGWLGLTELNPDATITDAVDLCVVGDPNQAIYAWNGADPRFLSAFSQRFPNGGLIRLEDNYRSTPQILTVADAVLGLRTRESRPLVPHRPDGDLPTVTHYPSDLEEARGVARKLREHHHERTPWKHMAILTRTNAQLAVFEEALRAAGIPHRVRGGAAFLQQPEVLRSLSVLQDGPTHTPLMSRLSDLNDLVDELGEDPNVVKGSDGTNDRVDQIEGLIRLGHEYLGAEPHGSVAGFVQWLHGAITSRSDEPERGGDVVELATFHRSKGLEWPIVFVVGLERGFVPIGQADHQDARDEERRLLYVAVTRAERQLHCSWAASRTFGARTTARTRSLWLDNVDAAITALGSYGSTDWQTTLQSMRERMSAAKAAGVPGTPGTKRASIEVGAKADPALFERLKAWRAAEARRTGIPAFTIMHDTSLAAIAQSRPFDEAALLTVAGVGTVKVGRYGAALLAIVAETPQLGTAPAESHMSKRLA